MIKQKIIQSVIFASALLMLATPSIAGKLYRFPDENGVPTISRSLPPAAAQNGYDILDDISLRLIEHVEPALTPEQFIEFKKQQQVDKEAQRQAEIDKQQAKEQADRAKQQVKREKQRRALNDQNLLTSFNSEQDFIASRDKALNHRQTRLTESTAKQSQLEQKLLTLQQQAAAQELSGKGVSTNLSKQLSTTQQQIDNNLISIEQSDHEITQLTQQYENDLIRLRELLDEKNNTVEN